jgi:mono/diheme cytochrome c family protein
MNSRNPMLALATLALSAMACGGSDATVTGYQLVLASGATPSVNAGDSVRVTVAARLSDNSIAPLSGNATVTWSANAPLVTAVSATPGAHGDLPAFGAAVTAVFISNPLRTDRPNDLGNELFFLDPGTAASPTFVLTGTLSGVTPAGTASLTFNVGPALVGNATNGAILYGAQGANCLECHGATGAGSPLASDGKYHYGGGAYDYPAQGLNAMAGHVAADASWNAALLAMSDRADMDNKGVESRAPMPDYLSTKPAGSQQVLTTQDYADIYAWLKTQTQ